MFFRANCQNMDVQLIYNFQMANKKTLKITIDGCHFSLFINFVALVIILLLWLRKRRQSQIIPQTINTIIQSKIQQKNQGNKRTQVIQKYREELKAIPIQSSGSNLQLIDSKKYSLHQTTQTDKSSPHIEQVKLLREELQIQRDRNQLLQQKQQKMETTLAKLRFAGDSTLPEDVQNLKNELEFCQEKLRQTIQSEAQLKEKLADYERMSISTLNHPEYQRLRNLNNKYKDTISQLQSHLLSQHEPRKNYFDLSFYQL